MPNEEIEMIRIEEMKEGCTGALLENDEGDVGVMVEVLLVIILYPTQLRDVTQRITTSQIFNKTHFCCRNLKIVN